MRAACPGPWVAASKNQPKIVGCYKDRGQNVNGFSSFANDKNVVMYWHPNYGGRWYMGDAVGKYYRAIGPGAGGPGPTAIAPDGWYTWDSAKWVKERLVVGE